jgi:N utilization substance protein B
MTEPTPHPAKRESGHAQAGGNTAPRARTAARVAAVQALFQSEQGPENPETVIDQFVRHRLGELPGTGGYEDGRVPDAHVKLFGRIVRMAAEKQAQLDGILEGVLPAEWPLGRLDPVLRALLRAGGAELAMRDGPPARVVINEYLDVAHGFFTGEEPRMANGLLDRLARALRPKEFPADAPAADLAAVPKAS